MTFSDYVAWFFFIAISIIVPWSLTVIFFTNMRARFRWQTKTVSGKRLLVYIAVWAFAGYWIFG